MNYSATKEMKNNLLFNQNNNINDICAPLYLLGITGFFYIKLYKDGTFVDLCTNLYSAEHYLRRFYACEYEIKDLKDNYLSNMVNLWELNKDNKIWAETRELFNIGNGFSMPLSPEANYTEIFFYYSDAHNYKINEFYINNLELFKNFATYFKDRAKKIITKAEQSKITIPEPYRQIYLPKVIDGHSSKIRDYYSKLDINKFYFSDHKYLTRKEAECLNWYASGKTIKQVAKTLGLSNKTVESHLDNIKKKLNCCNKASLVNAAISSGIFDFFQNKLVINKNITDH